MAGTTRLLVIDDQEIICRFFKEVLSPYGYEVLSAVNAGKGFDILRTKRPDVVLLDLKMPGFDGIEGLKRIKEIDRDMPVIIMTGHGSMDTVREAMEFDAYDYLTKPFDIDLLEMVIRNAVKGTEKGKKVSAR